MTWPRPRFTLIAADTDDALAGFAQDVAAGLGRRPKQLACRYFYDAEGSRLFDAICALPEYYLPRAEREILERHAAELVSGFPPVTTLVELGSGSATKTRLAIEAFLARQATLRYVPIDIARPVLEASSRALLDTYPGLDIVAVAAEYHPGLAHLRTVADGPKLVLWLGSNVGNFDRPGAAAFLRQVGSYLSAADRLLVGIDLRKDRDTLERAYDDARGVTARFNLNLLARINRELGGHFDVGAFRHRAVYHDAAGRIEMYLDSVRDQRVAIDRLGQSFEFAAGEAIHTEDSYKYSPAEIEALARAAGLRVERQWFDPARRFSDTLFAPV